MKERKSLFVVFSAIVMIMVFMASVNATGFRTYEEMYKQLPGFGRVNHSSVIDQALKTVIKMQELREGWDLTIENPIDVQIYNPRFLSISFNVNVKARRGSARAKPSPAVYSLLFEKDDQDNLTFYKSIFLAWIGSKAVENYKEFTPDKMCEYFRAKGADYVFLEKKVELVQQDAGVLNGNNIRTGIVSEKYIDNAITRDSELKAALRGYARKDSTESSGKPADEARIQKLEARIKKLEALLANVMRSGNDLIFNDMNVYIQNGTGSESKINGTGNLIVGYDDPGKGSHNIIVGSKNTCTSYGALVSGQGNVVTKKYGVVVGGENNKIRGDYAVILGGTNNDASGDFSSILGGSDNKAKGKYSSINGQQGRTKVDKDANKHFRN